MRKTTDTTTDNRQPTPETVIPAVKEFATVDKVQAVVGEVLINKQTEQRTEEVAVALKSVGYVETRIPKQITVSEMPQIRTEGDTTIIPVVREEVVVTTRLVLVEEIHLRREEVITDTIIPVTLSEDKVTVSRK